MADRILTWHIPGVLSESGVAEANTLTQYIADEDYVPKKVWILQKTAPSGGLTTIDINDDGTSLFTTNPSLPADMTTAEWTTFNTALLSIKKDSVLTLDVDSVSSATPGADLTVHLELDKA